MLLNNVGQIVVREWERSEEMRDNVVLDAFVVMPNHLHGIVCIVPTDVDGVTLRGYDLRIGPGPQSTGNANLGDAGTNRNPSPRERDQCPRKHGDRPRRHSGSLGSLVAGFKGAVTRRINRDLGTIEPPIWQSRYYDLVLRSEQEWRACRRYIDQNPARWVGDRNHSHQR